MLSFACGKETNPSQLEQWNRHAHTRRIHMAEVTAMDCKFTIHRQMKNNRTRVLGARFRLEFRDDVDRKIFVEKFYYCHSSVGRWVGWLLFKWKSHRTTDQKTLNAISTAHRKSQAGNKIVKRSWFLLLPAASLPACLCCCGRLCWIFFFHVLSLPFRVDDVRIDKKGSKPVERRWLLSWLWHCIYFK